ncbi:hypothetical protein JHW43_008702 [Diplocarpon mali]|nr:hypothetical protein JHW43_008702 [Diplocarpon mali]
MFSTVIRRAAQPKIQFDIHANPYKATRLWPPDFSKIDRKHQFRLERKYKRRAKLKWARPGWTKAVKIAQMSSILFIAVYGVLFLDWNEHRDSEHKPFEGVNSVLVFWLDGFDMDEGSSEEETRSGYSVIYGSSSIIPAKEYQCHISVTRIYMRGRANGRHAARISP